MARKYNRIKQYEIEIMEMHKAGKSHREIGEALRLSRDQIKEFLRRPRRKIAVHKRKAA